MAIGIQGNPERCRREKTKKRQYSRPVSIRKINFRRLSQKKSATAHDLRLCIERGHAHQIIP